MSRKQVFRWCLQTLVRAALVGGALVLLMALVAPEANAGTILVTTMASGTGGAGDCTLQEAIEAANTDTAVDACAAGSGADTIIIGNCNITLLGSFQVDPIDGPIGLPDITTDIRIMGIDPSVSTIERSAAAADFAIFRVLAGGILSFENVTVQNGRAATGGAVINRGGTLNITASTFQNNQATGVAGGGAIVNFAPGTLTISNSTFTNNLAVSGPAGGIRNESTLDITSSTFVANSAATIGGAMDTFVGGAPVTITDSFFFGNQAGFFGGAIHHHNSPLTITGSNFFSNSAGLGNNTSNGGGAIEGFGPWTITNSYFDGNLALSLGNPSDGGALRYIGDNLMVSGSTFSNNAASSRGGAIELNGGGIPPIHYRIINSTVSGNSTPNDSGAGIDLRTGSLDMNNVTITENFAEVNGGGIYLVSSTTLTVRNTILAANPASGFDCFTEVSATFTSQGHNLIGNNSNCTIGGPGTGDTIGTGAAPVDPMLGTLQTTAGLTPTHPLRPGSPAIDAGDMGTPGSGGTACEATDQRGAVRPDGLACDIGAHEGVLPLADLSVTMSDMPDPVTFGSNITYTITVTNSGPDTAPSVTLGDAMPNDTGFVSATPSQGNCPPPFGAQLGCDLGDIPSGGMVTVTLIFTANQAGTITNTVLATSLGDEPNFLDNFASETTTVLRDGDLKLTKSAPAQALLSANFDYTLTVENLGSTTVNNFTVTDTLPAGVAFVSATAGCSESGGVVTCNIASLAGQTSAVLTITVTAPSTVGNIINSATVTAAGDPDTANDTDTAQTLVRGNPILVITKTDTPDPVAAGNNVTYTITVTNEGPDPATGVVVVDSAPIGSTFVSVSSTLGSCTDDGTTGTCTIGTLNSSASVVVTFVVRADFPCILNNTALVTSNENLGGTPATQSTTVGPAIPPDLSISKSHTGDFTVGVQDTYTIVVSNVGAGDTTGPITVTDTLPAELTFVIGTGTGWSCSAAGQDVTCTNPGTVAAGTSAPVLTITVSVLGPAGSILNTASVSTTGDANAANDSAMDPTQINAFSCTKTAISSGNWSNPAIWSPSGVPGAGDDVCIPVGITVDLDTAQTIRSLSMDGTLNMTTGSLTFSVASQMGGTFNFSGGTLIGASADMTLNGQWNWSGGAVTGGAQVHVNNGVTMSGGAKTISGHAVNMNGTAIWTAGNVTLANGASWNILPSGSLEVRGDFSVLNGGGPAPAMNIAGAFQKTMGSGTATINIAANVIGSLSVSTGTVSLAAGGTSSGTFNVLVATFSSITFSGGTHDLTSTSVVTGPGGVGFNGGTTNVAGTYDTGGTTVFGGVPGGTVNFNVSATTGILNITGGTLGGTGAFTVTGNASWNGNSFMTGTGSTTIMGTLSLNTTSLPGLIGRTMNTMGPTNWNGSGRLDAGGGATWNNSGLFDIQSDANYTNAAVGGASAFDNLPSGTVMKSGGSTITQFSGVTFQNAGIVTIDMGTISFVGSTYMQTAGLTRLNGGSLSGGITFDFAGGLLDGVTGSVITGNVNNSGANVNPGMSPGLLNIVGNYIQGLGGTLTIQLGGTMPVDFDRLAITGSATLGGTLDLTGVSFAPAGGDSFQIMTYGSNPGPTNFGTINNMTGSAAALVTTPGATDYIVSFQAAGCVTFDNDSGDGLWTTATNWSGDMLPGSTDCVVIPAGQTATLTMGAQMVDSVTVDGTLNISGGSLVTTTAFTVNGTLNVNGPTVTVTSVFTNNGAVNVNSGTLRLNGGGSSGGSFAFPAGAILEFGAGMYTLTATSSVLGTGNGTVSVTGATLDVNGSYNSSTNLSAGTLNFNSTASINSFFMTGGTQGGTGTVTVTGSFQWSGGSLVGGGVTRDRGNGSITGNVTLNGRTLTTEMFSCWCGGTINVGNGAVWNIFGTLSIQSDESLIFNQGGANLQMNVNGGVISKSQSALGTSSIGAVVTNNGGTVTGTAGTLNFAAGFTQTSGTTSLFGGNFAGTTFNFNGGSVIGNGTITGNVVNSGAAFAPILPPDPGILAIVGNYTQGTSGILDIELAGTGGVPGTDFDQVTVTGVAMLDGMLNVRSLGGFMPMAGNAFPVLTYASLVNDFASAVDLTGSGLVMVTTPGANTYVVSFQTAATADLTVMKTDSPDPVDAGLDLTYTVTVNNGGPDDATNVVLTDPLPTGASFVSAMSSQGTCSQASGTVTCNLGTLAVSASATVTIVVRPTAAGGSPISNTASVTSAASDPNLGDNSATASTTVNLPMLLGPSPYLSLNDSPFLAGIQAGTVALETFEDGRLDVPGVTVSGGSPIGPSGITDSVDGDDGTIDGSGTGGWSFFFGAGSTGITFTFSAAVLGNLPTQAGIVWTDGGGITTFEAFDAAGISLGVTGPVAIADGSINGTTGEDRFFGITHPGGISAIRISNSSGGIEVDHLQYGPVPAPVNSDLTVTKTAAPSPVNAGADVTYTITVTNAGVGTASGVTLTDMLPAGTSFVSATPSQGTCTGTTTVSCSLGSLGTGAQATVTIVATVPGTGSIINTATVASGSNELFVFNNSSMVSVSITGIADLSMSKADSPDPVAVTDNLTYTLTVTNNGPSPATGVALSDVLPGGVNFVSATPSQGTCTPVPGGVTCNLGSLNSGANATVTIVVVPTATGTITNSASVTANEPDPNASDNAASQDTTVVAASADVQLTKTDSPDPVIINQNLTYTLTVRNNGPQAAQNVVVTDTLPSGPTFISATAPCTQSGGIVNCNLGTLASGAQTVITIVVQPLVAGSLTNTASVSSTTADPNTANNSATATTTVSSIPFTATFSGPGTATVDSGGTVTVTVTITPNQPGITVAVTCGPPLPPDTTCTVQPSALVFPTLTPQTVTITIKTTECILAGRTVPRGPQFPMGDIRLMWPMLFVMALLLWVSLARRDEQLKRLTPVVILLLFVVLMSGCAAAGGPVSNRQFPIGTLPGTYTVPVTFNSGGQSQTLNFILNVNL